MYLTNFINEYSDFRPDDIIFTSLLNYIQVNPQINKDRKNYTEILADLILIKIDIKNTEENQLLLFEVTMIIKILNKLITIGFNAFSINELNKNILKLNTLQKSNLKSLYEYYEKADFLKKINRKSKVNSNIAYKNLFKIINKINKSFFQE